MSVNDYAGGMNYSGIAAAEELDRLNTAADFEPATEVDTVALDATIEALAAAKALVSSLTALKAHLADAGEADDAVGLSIEVHTDAERLDALLVDVVLPGTFETRAGVVL